MTRGEWTDERLSEAFKSLDAKLDRIVKTQRASRRDARAAAERARRDWLTFFAPVAVALIGLLGTIVTLILTKA